MEQHWKTTVFQLIRLFIVLFFIVAAIWLLGFVIPLIYPFIIGLIIALIINRPVNALEGKTKLPRWAAVSIVLVFLIVIVFGAFTLLITQLVIEITHLIALMPVYIQDATNYLNQFITQEIVTNFYDNIQHYYQSLDEGYKEKIGENIGLGLTKIAAAGTFLVNSLLNGLQIFLTSLPNAATVLVISLLAAFFISNDFYRLKHKIANWLPQVFKARLAVIFNDLKKALFGFVKAQVTLVSITGFIVVIGLIVLRVEYAFTIGIITGILDLLPLLGTGFVFVPWIIYLFIKGNFSLVIGLSILYGIVIVQRQIMEPKIVAENIGLDPLVTLISLFVGLKLFGVAGLILGPVTVVILNALINAHVFEDLWKYIKGEPI
ncbi:sporulation integral membrane protein YtvI [Ammoniphilus sp. CFH 90114]|uniref:sporulation integral membrane protein YtvI n=1 Tax=Ammoniphilus sp. CFH 90114 TaxID=2493665 RepID=UPI00100DC980|nr:sporulation integral membrane protein YtvI [Ammoniphilus sp. CFH 90114]RXT04780.1 sporulation integral membrane protein YtvI [Ammoniphilus sp. CFH 90114]